MRCTSLSFVLSNAVLAAAVLAPPAQSAPAMFGPLTPQAQQPAEKSSGWGWLGLGKKQSAPAPPTSSVLSDAQASPTGSSSTWTALKNNPLRTALVGKPSPEPQKKPDVLSLQTPTGGPSPKTCLLMAQIAEAKGDLPGAREQLKKALALDPKNVKTLREIGHLEDRQGRLKLAESMYRRALAIEPQNAAVLNDLAICCARQDRLEDAAVLLERAIQVKPEKTLYRNNIAKVLVELGHQDVALQHLAAGHSPAAANFNMGQLLSSKGDAAGAARCFQLAAQLDPQFTAAHAALTKLSAAQPESTDAVHVAAAPKQAAIDPAPAANDAAAAPSVDDGITPLASDPNHVEVDLNAPMLLPPVTQQ